MFMKVVARVGDDFDESVDKDAEVHPEERVHVESFGLNANGQNKTCLSTPSPIFRW